MSVLSRRPSVCIKASCVAATLESSGMVWRSWFSSVPEST